MARGSQLKKISIDNCYRTKKKVNCGSESGKYEEDNIGIS
jgi:hypothetical protein